MQMQASLASRLKQDCGRRWVVKERTVHEALGEEHECNWTREAQEVGCRAEGGQPPGDVDALAAGDGTLQRPSQGQHQ